MSHQSVTAKVIICDYAQEAGGKLTLVGCGFDFITGGVPAAVGVGLVLEVPWTETNQKHSWAFSLMDEDGSPVTTPDGKPLTVGEEFEVGRPPACPQGMAFNFVRALNLNGVVFDVGKRYVVRVSIDGAAPSDAACATFTARLPQGPPVNRAA